MKIKFLFLNLTLLALFFIILSPKTVAAVDYSFSGTVKDSNGAFIEGATINIYTPNTTNDVVPPTTTNQSGNFSFASVPQGVYDVKVIPPNGYNFAPIIAEDYDLSDNIIINFIFASVGSSRLSGHIYDQDGNPMQGIAVVVDQNA